jgi:hypothetical protein
MLIVVSPFKINTLRNAAAIQAQRPAILTAMLLELPLRCTHAPGSKRQKRIVQAARFEEFAACDPT